MKGFASIPQAAEAAAGAPAGSAGSASPPRTSAEWSRTYLQHRVTFDAAKAQCSLGIANLDGLCASMCLIAASNGERAPVRVGVGYHDIGCYWTNLLRCRLGPCGVLSLRAFAMVCTRRTLRLWRAVATFARQSGWAMWLCYCSGFGSSVHSYLPRWA